MSQVVLDSVSFRYANAKAVEHVSIEVHPGEFFALLGPSGSGKTSILRLIAGFNTPQSGRILIDGEDMKEIPPYRRRIGFVFQNYALFPHMSVAENVAFGLESQSVPKHLVRERVYDALNMVQLSGYEKRRPSQLSGGQQQRVAFARAVVTEPQVLLLDEPLASLDRKLRSEMQVELRQLQQRLQITTVYVTHDQEEALTLADRLAVMNAGRIEQIGEPLTVYSRPNTRFVAEFLGISNVFTGEVIGYAPEGVIIRTAGGTDIKAQMLENLERGERVQVMVRPEQMRVSITPPADPGALNMVNAHIRHITFTGTSLTYHLSGNDEFDLRVFEQSSLQATPPPVGAEVCVSWSPLNTFIIARQ